MNLNSKITDTSGQDVVLPPRAQGRKFLLVAIGLSVMAFIVWLALPVVQRWSQAQISVDASRLRFAEVSRGDFERDVSVQGRVVAAVSPTLYATQNGTITFAVESGDAVHGGQVLARIESPELENRLLQEQSRLSSLDIELQRQRITTRQQQLENQKSRDAAAISLKAARRELTRSERAYEQGAITEVDYEKARDDLETAELLHSHSLMDTELDNERLEFELQTSQLAREQQQLLVDDLARQVSELIIESPVNGIVGNLLVDQKTNVARNQPVVSVVDLTAFEVEIQVPESYADDLAIGMQAEVRAGTEISQATLVAVSPEIIDNQVTGRVRFSKEAPAGLRQNQRLTTRILLEEKFDVVMVQRGQFIDSGNGRVAYVLENGIAYRRPIMIGATSLSHVEVLEGLQPGENIVVSSTEIFNSAETVLINN
jgi:HlyD family secretion protein